MLKQASWAVALVSLFALSFHEARAQSDEKKFEAGGQFSLLRLQTRTVTDITPAESRVNAFVWVRATSQLRNQRSQLRPHFIWL